MSKKRDLLLLSAAAAGFTAAVLFLALWKWNHAAYNGIDLAYFAQAIWNTAHGRLFAFSIHPGLTLGDHAEWLLLPIALVYGVVPHPLVLVFLQTLALAASAFVVHRIAARLLPASWALPAALAFLLLPIPGNAALFEFHVLVFALPLLLLAADAYLEKRFDRFLLFLALSLLAREDVALVTFFFGFVALCDRRSIRWIAAPMLVSSAWFAAMMLVIRQFSVGGGYKFFAYYAWLWPFDPLALLRHLAQLTQLEFLVGLLMPVLLLPLLRPKWLLLALPIWLQLALSASGAGAVLLQSHYAVLLLPGVILATFEVLAWLPQSALVRRLPGNGRPILAMLLVVAVVFSAVTLGPFVRSAPLLGQDTTHDALTRALRLIPPDATVAASARFLPELAHRERLYALHYLMLGTTQFGAAPYEPSMPDMLIYDESDLLAWHANFPTLAWTRDRYAPGFARLREMIDRGGYGVVFRDGGITLWQRGSPRPQVSGSVERAAALGTGVRFAPIDGGADLCPGHAGTCFTFLFTSDAPIADDLLLRLTPTSSPPILHTFGMLPTFDWQPGRIIVVPITIVPERLNGLGVELVSASGDLTLDALGTATVSWKDVRPAGREVLFNPEEMPAAPDAGADAPAAGR